MVMRVPRVPGAIGEYPTPNPVAKRRKKRLIFILRILEYPIPISKLCIPDPILNE
jgi:hypothetical protein